MTIAVIGLGLIGGSFALAAKACGWRVVGIDKCPATLQLAAQHLDVVSDNVALINEADAVFVAVPMRQAMTPPKVNSSSSLMKSSENGNWQNLPAHTTQKALYSRRPGKRITK